AVAEAGAEGAAATRVGGGGLEVGPVDDHGAALVGAGLDLGVGPPRGVAPPARVGAAGEVALQQAEVEQRLALAAEHRVAVVEAGGHVALELLGRGLLGLL